MTPSMGQVDEVLDTKWIKKGTEQEQEQEQKSPAWSGLFDT